MARAAPCPEADVAKVRYESGADAMGDSDALPTEIWQALPIDNIADFGYQQGY